MNTKILAAARDAADYACSLQKDMLKRELRARGINPEGQVWVQAQRALRQANADAEWEFVPTKPNGLRRCGSAGHYAWQ